MLYANAIHARFARSYAGPDQSQDRDRDQRPDREQDQEQKTGYICYTQLAAARIHAQDQTSPHNQTRQNPKHLTETAPQSVTRQSGPDQEPRNLDRQTEAQAGAGQKKQLSHCGYIVVFKYVTQHLYISNNIFQEI